MPSRLRSLRGRYPSQFWLMLFGMLISTIGGSMVWPFLMIYVTTRLNLPLTTAASLMSLNAAVTLASSFIAGPIIDRVGRKWMMVISLAGLAGVYIFYTQASSYAMVALLMALTGLVNPLYRVAGDAMMADLIPSEQRPDAYALLRMSNNVGVAIGPAIGGFVAAASYNYAFLGAAAGMGTYAVLLAILARETLPAKVQQAALHHVPAPAHEPFGGYLRIFADRPFVYFVIAFTLNQIGAALVWVLLGVHAKTHYGLSESLYGFIPMTNAIMVVVLQAVVTRQTKRRAPLRMLALGSLFYTVAVTSVAFGAGFWGFWASMVVMTIGELILMPTSTTYVADLAPTDMRGRYMSIYGLTWGIATGIGPVMGGFLADTISPAATWIGGGIFGLLAVMAFLLLSGRKDKVRHSLIMGADLQTNGAISWKRDDLHER